MTEMLTGYHVSAEHGTSSAWDGCKTWLAKAPTVPARWDKDLKQEKDLARSPGAAGAEPPSSLMARDVFSIHLNNYWTVTCTKGKYNTSEV